MKTSEDKLTAWFESQCQYAPDKIPIGIGDDMAHVNLPGHSVLVTTDMLVETVHFDLAQASLEQVGYKAMAVNLSDCAGMATVPMAAVVALALPQKFTEDQLKELYRGILQAASTYQCPLIGGDLCGCRAGDPLTVNITMLSRPGENAPITRTGAQIGDCLCVTGSLGGSYSGKHLCFEPRIKEALSLSGLAKIHAMLDISDGLSADLNRICTRSQVGAILNSQAIPVSLAAQASQNPLDAALNDGEDFELLFTLDETEYTRLQTDWNHPTPVTCIGITTQDRRIRIKAPDGNLSELKIRGYDHFSPRREGEKT
jgi:thiamine-monophosphate kinase